MDASAEVITAVPRTETKVKIHPIVFSLDLAKHAWDPRLNMTEVHTGAELRLQKLANHCSGVLLFALIRHLLPSKKPHLHGNLLLYTSVLHIFPSLSLLLLF